MSNLPSNSLQEGEHNLQEMKTKSPAWSSKGYHMYEIFVTFGRLFVALESRLVAIVSILLHQFDNGNFNSYYIWCQTFSLYSFPVTVALFNEWC